MAYEPLHHKYRPQTFAQLVGQDAIATTLTNALRQGRIAPAYLLCGPRGTGKTSSARILAKSLNCNRHGGPSSDPCGTCESCIAIANGSALDFVEIDAASNTGVDNIRELIERAQFAPVQCRYKVYVIDECLTGDTQVLTKSGWIPIDDPNLKGEQALSYNESFGRWEFKPITRWLDQGKRPILKIQTSLRQLRCTENHLLRTAEGWLAAKDLKPGVKILAPVSIDRKNPLEAPDIYGWKTGLEEIVAIEKGGLEPVYDIEVSDHHNFVANGLLVHNCHMLSVAAFNALLKTLEEPPERVVFVLATTDPQRVLPTIISRCQRFDYRRIPLEAMLNHLQMIAQQEAIAIKSDALRLVAQVSQGGLRDAQSLLDQLSLLEPPITAEKVWDLVGAVPERDLLELVRAIATNNGAQVLEQVRRLMDRGREPLIVLQNLAGFYRDLLIAKTAGSRQDLVAVTPSTWDEMQSLAQDLPLEVILAGQQHLRTVEVQVKNTTQPRLWLEVSLLGLLPSTLKDSQAAHPLTATATVASTSVTAPVVSSPPSSQAPKSTISAQPTSLAPSNSPREELTPAPQAASLESNPEPAASQISGDLRVAPTRDLSQLWQQVLGVLQPFGTRALMNQQGTLLELDGQKARIGISSKPLFKMAQGRIANVEAAFKEVLNQSIKVSLEVMPEGQKPPTPGQSTAQQPSQSTAESTASPGYPTPATFESNTPTHQISDTSAAEKIVFEPQESDQLPPEIPTVEIASDLDRAVKSFAQFFNGQIVNLDIETAEGESKFSGEPDKDVPF